MPEEREKALEELCELTLDLINAYERVHGSPGWKWEAWRAKARQLGGLREWDERGKIVAPEEERA